MESLYYVAVTLYYGTLCIMSLLAVLMALSIILLVFGKHRAFEVLENCFLISVKLFIVSLLVMAVLLICIAGMTISLVIR